MIYSTLSANLVAVLFSALLTTANALGYPRSDNFVTMPYKATRSIGLTYSFYGEGLEYYEKQDSLLLGSMNTAPGGTRGKIFSIPYYNKDAAVDGIQVMLGEDEMTEVFAGDASMPGIFGLEMEPTSYAGSSSHVWAAGGSYPPTTTTPCGVGRINIETGALEAYYDFTSLRSTYAGGRCFANDITFDADNNIYVTDSFGYQVFMIDYATNATSVFLNDINFLCSERDNCMLDQDDMANNGPNGLEVTSGQDLLIAVSPSRLVKAILPGSTSGETVGLMYVVGTVPALAVQGADGIKFDAAKNALYVAGYGTSGSIQAFVTKDNWGTALLRTVYDANCENDGVTSLALARGADIAAYCSNAFGAAPYNITTLNGVGNTNPYMFMQTSMNNDTYLRPEGIEYYNNDLIVSSLSTGAIKGFSAVPAGLPASVYWNEADDLTVYYPGSEMIYGTLGLQMSKTDSCILYFSFGGFPPRPDIHDPLTGLGVLNVCTKELLGSVSFDDVSDVNLTMANDITVIGNTAYVSDTFGSQIFIVENLDSPHHLNAKLYKNPEQLLNPNGMENYDDRYIIVAAYYEGLDRVDTKKHTHQRVEDSSGLVFDLDGLYFNSDKTILYATKRDDTVLALTSNDDWVSVDVLYVFDANCGSVPSAGVIGGGNYYTTCSDNLGEGPYYTTYYPSIDETVANGYDFGATDKKSNGGGDDDEDEQRILGLSIALIIAVVIVLALVTVYVIVPRFCKKQSDTASLAGHELGGKNPMV